MGTSFSSSFLIVIRDKLGTTDDEMNRALVSYGLSHLKEDVKRYYNGYKTATEVQLFNTWSSLNVLHDRALESYWHQTGSTFFLGKLIWESGLDMKVHRVICF